MQFGVLGPLAVWTDDGTPVGVPGVKVRALLADLLVHPGRLLSADRLVDDLWGEQLPGNPAGALQGKVSQLRRALEDAEPGGRDLVRYASPGYTLDIVPEASDAGRFEALLKRARPLVADDPHGALALLDEALGLWRGPVLAEFVDEEFARTAINHLEEARVTAVEARIEARLALGEHSAVIGELDGLVEAHPLRERLRGLHMRALYGAGRQAEALDSYRQLRAQLGDELGLDPSPELGELERAILEQDAALDTPPPPAPARPRTNVPAPRTALVGAAAQVGRVTDLLAATRLVTLTGPGGVGKTQMALEVARGLADQCPGGVWLVELASTLPSGTADMTAALAEQVAAVLDVRDETRAAGPGAGTQADLVARIAATMGDQPLLLVLDNCEHVLEAAARLADDLLGSAAGLRILATSRTPLWLTGEQLWPVAPLAVPEDLTDVDDPDELEGFDAVRLFVDRAVAATPQFTLDAGNAAAVAAICQRLDGLPLALELAAARLRVLTVDDLAARLDDRFGLLTAGPRDAPDRQQTLLALVDWSWELLSAQEQTVLARLSVFAGAASLPAVEAVCATGDADALDVLARLVDHSLVIAEVGADGGRYRMLETVRAYGLRKLDESGQTDAVRQRHAAFHVALAEQADQAVRGHDQQRWLERLDAEAANLRAAADWAAEGEAEAGLLLRLANALAWYQYLRGRQGQACRQLIRALGEEDRAPPAVRAKALAWVGSLGALDRSVDDPAEHGKTALALYAELHEPADEAHAKLLLAGLLLPRGELPDADRLVAQALDTFRGLDEPWGSAGALSIRGWLELARGDLEAARRDGEQAQALYAEAGDAWGQVRSAELLAQIAEIHGDYERATALHRAALERAEALGLWASAALELGRLGRLALLAGDYDASVDLHEQALRLSRDLSFEQGTAFARVGLGLVARRQGRLDDAEGHLTAVLDWHQERGFDSGVAFCTAELGFVAELRGDAERADDLHRDGLQAARASDDSRALALALEGLAGAAAPAGDPRRAALLLGAASATRAAADAVLPPAERNDVDRITSLTETALGAGAFAEAFGEGQAMSPEAVSRLVDRELDRSVS